MKPMKPRVRPAKLKKLAEADVHLRLLPPTIKIGPHTWKLVLTDQTQAEKELDTGKVRVWGVTNLSALTISLSPDMPNKGFAVGTFIHEIYHAGLYSFGLNNPKNEEAAAVFAETLWTTLYRDNPWLLVWIQKGLK